MSLIPADYARFEKLGISKETLALAGVRRVTHQEAIDDCGIRYKSDHLEGIAFRYADPTTGQTTSWRVRRDHPERDADGKMIAKYLSPPDRRHFYYAPNAKDLLVDVRVDAIFVEAESSVLALYDSGRRGNRLPRLMLGLGGCWGWRGKIGKEVDADGTPVDVKGPLTDFDRIAWGGRNVHLVFDSNAASNPSVQVARDLLAAELQRRGAIPYIAALPTFDGNGPDDFITAHGDDALWSLIAGARRWSKAEARKAAKHRAVSGGGDDIVGSILGGLLSSRGSQGSVLLELALKAGAELFHDDDIPYVRVPIHNSAGDHHETYRLRSRAARAWLVNLYVDDQNRAPNAQGLGDATAALEAKALRGPNVRVHVRIAAQGGHIYLDLANDTWAVVDIDRVGWRLTVDPPVRFRRPKGLAALPIPVSNGEDIATMIRPFVNTEKKNKDSNLAVVTDSENTDTDDSDLILIIAVLLSYLRGRGPYPVLVLNGEQGASKSTLSRVIKALIDPNVAPLRSAPKEPRDLMIAAIHSHILCFDNLSVLPGWLSDAMCRLATGGGFSTRTLFTDDEEQIFDALRPVVLNGIPEVASRQDLVGRSIFVTLPAIAEEKRKAEAVFWAKFEYEQPFILGALLDIVSVALEHEPTTTLTRAPRMADFASWIVAAESACPWETGAFMKAYDTNQTTAIVASLDGDPVGDLVRGLTAPPGFSPLTLPWEGTARDLLAALNERASDQLKRHKGWFTQPKQVSDALRRIAPALRQLGFEVTFSKAGRSRTRTISIDRKPASASSASSGTNPSTDAADAADAEVPSASLPPTTDSSVPSRDDEDADDGARF